MNIEWRTIGRSLKVKRSGEGSIDRVCAAVREEIKWSRESCVSLIEVSAPKRGVKVFFAPRPGGYGGYSGCGREDWRSWDVAAVEFACEHPRPYEVKYAARIAGLVVYEGALPANGEDLAVLMEEYFAPLSANQRYTYRRYRTAVPVGKGTRVVVVGEDDPRALAS
jgi:hypothetical protein